MRVKINSELVKKLRKEKSWTQEDLAEQSGIHSRTIQRLESQGNAAVRSLNAISLALGVESYTLEYRTNKIDFEPLFIELRILILAITRRFMPIDERNLPNRLITLFLLLAYSASFTLINAIILIFVVNNPNLDSISMIATISLALLFTLFFAGLVYPLFKLKEWARKSMIAVFLIFLTINILLLVEQLILKNSIINWGKIIEYSVNLFVATWVYRTLTNREIKGLFLKRSLRASV